MREIKFRAWDSLNKTFFVPIYEAYLGRLHDISISMSGQVIERTIRECADIRNSDRFIIMQYTGLKDKNGKEIYEGDVLNVEYKDCNDNTLFDTYKVEYIAPSFKMIAVNSEIFKSGSEVFIPGKINEIAEIIGNIYENSELLNA